MTTELRNILPDFYIAGAAKSGTTSLANALRRHPEVVISRPKEAMVFCMDDIYVHPDLFFESYSEWEKLNMHERPEQTLKFVFSQAFEHAEPGQKRGEATPFYMFSRLALERIAKHTPDARIIFILRHPTSRCISNYWQEVKVGRASRPFWNSIRFEQPWALHASSYRRPLEDWYQRFDAEQILILPFERWRKNKELVMREICAHIGVDHQKLETERGGENRGQSSLLPLVDRALGELVQQIGGTTYSFHKYTQEGRTEPYVVEGVQGHIVHEARKMQARLRRKRGYPGVSADKKMKLDRLFERENRGLSALTGVDFKSWWDLDV